MVVQGGFTVVQGDYTGLQLISKGIQEVPYISKTDHIAVVTRGEAGERFPVSIGFGVVTRGEVGFGDSTPRLLHLPDNRLLRLRDRQQLSNVNFLNIDCQQLSNVNLLNIDCQQLSKM